jgi:hypothetical protein
VLLLQSEFGVLLDVPCEFFQFRFVPVDRLDDLGFSTIYGSTPQARIT